MLCLTQVGLAQRTKFGWTEFNSRALARSTEYMDVFCNPTLSLIPTLSGYGKKRLTQPASISLLIIH